MRIIQVYTNEDDILQFFDNTEINVSAAEFGFKDFLTTPHVQYINSQSYGLFFIIRGKGRYQIGSKSYPLEENDVFMSYPGASRKLIADPDKPWKFFWINFDGKSASALLENSKFSSKMPSYTLKRPELFMNCIDRLLSAYQNRIANFRLRTLGILLEMFAQISEERNTSSQDTLYDSTDYYISEIIKYIKNNFSSPTLKAEDICKKLFISHSYLCKIFKNFANNSVSHYIIEYRMEQAKLLLKLSDKKISTIASEVGYTSSAYFCSEFKRLFGISPSEYRATDKNAII